MKAMALIKQSPIEDKPLSLIDVPRPEPADNQILVKVSVCGACRTDLDIAEGRINLDKLPRVLGHQIVGVVADKGRGAKKFKTGDRVGITWIYRSCRKCSFCTSGR